MSPQTSADARTPLSPVRRYVTDAGLETELIFHDGLELPHFISATLVGHADGRERLERYYRSFVSLAERHDFGVLLETPTWRISRDWAERIGVDRDGRRRLNHESVALLSRLRDESELAHDAFVISGNLGPRYDGYSADQRMTPEEAATYHREQVADLREAGAHIVSALTIANASEAVGIAQAANGERVPVVISFTVETDGRLPSGEALEEAIERVDAESSVAYFGINCAHPSHFRPTLEPGGAWTSRLGSLRSNASKMSHEELDGSEELDEGDPDELAEHYAQLYSMFPSLRVFGGCCGTDARHVTRMCDALVGQR